MARFSCEPPSWRFVETGPGLVNHSPHTGVKRLRSCCPNNVAEEGPPFVRRSPPAIIQIIAVNAIRRPTTQPSYRFLSIVLGFHGKTFRLLFCRRCLLSLSLSLRSFLFSLHAFFTVPLFDPSILTRAPQTGSLNTNRRSCAIFTKFLKLEFFFPDDSDATVR